MQKKSKTCKRFVCRFLIFNPLQRSVKMGRKSIADFRWHVSTNQKMNKGLKYIAKRAKITKDLHMHLARHTFATTVTLANGIPIETVSKMLGHASIRQIQHYTRVIPLKIKLDMEKIKDLYK